MKQTLLGLNDPAARNDPHKLPGFHRPNDHYSKYHCSEYTAQLESHSSRSGSILGSLCMVTLLCFSVSAYADHGQSRGNSYYTYGQVLEVEPNYVHSIESVPEKSCTQVQVRQTHHRPHRRRDEGTLIPSLLGGLLGGVIGHQFGGGNGKTALTILGAFAGSKIASSSNHHHQHDRHSQARVREHCTIVERWVETTRIKNYSVTYRYKGNVFTKTTPENPGSRIRIRVQVDPVDNLLAQNDSRQNYSRQNNRRYTSGNTY
jgi:uncharacterized protein YcfJ